LIELLSYHEIRVGQIHKRPTRPKIRVGFVLHGSGAYAVKSLPCISGCKVTVYIVFILCCR